MAVVLNGFTTMAGFASLMVAHHRGIFGLGLLLTVGMTASLFASLVVLPVLLRIFYGPAAPDEGRSDPVSRSRGGGAAVDGALTVSHGDLHGTRPDRYEGERSRSRAWSQGDPDRRSATPCSRTVAVQPRSTESTHAELGSSHSRLPSWP